MPGRGGADLFLRRALSQGPPPLPGRLEARRVVAWLRRLLRPPLHLAAVRSGILDLLHLYHPGLAAHSERTARCVRAVAPALGCGPRDTARIELAALFHDLGKVLLPREVLYAPRRLGRRELRLVRSHPRRGAGLLLSLGRPLPPGLLDVVAHHHERWDGQGYPARLARHEIPFGARLVAVADVLDAMTHPRPYRPTLTAAEARLELLAGAGSQFDPGLVLAVLAHSLDVPFPGSAS